MCKSCFNKTFSNEQIKKFIDFDKLIKQYEEYQNRHKQTIGEINILRNEFDKL